MEPLEPHPAVATLADLPENVPDGVIVPVDRPASVWLRVGGQWTCSSGIVVDDFGDLPDDAPVGTRAMVRVAPMVRRYYVNVGGGWAIDGDMEMRNNWSFERRVEYKLDQILELLKKGDESGWG